MKPVLFGIFCKKDRLDAFYAQFVCELGEFEVDEFPDHESYLKLKTDVKGREVIFLTALDNPNSKILALIFAANIARENGAKNIGLIAPYLPYMRQDKIFKVGEGVTSSYFAKIISTYFDWLVTIDPHLHRHHALSDIYTIPAYACHATDAIVKWLKARVTEPLIIGPDSESEQWVSQVAQALKAPYVILEKMRIDASTVKISIPKIAQYKQCTPVLLDDIIATGHTMLETVQQLKKITTKAPICVAVHGIFANDIYTQLLKMGIAEIASCNTIAHPSNQIDVTQIMVSCLQAKILVL